MSVKPWGEGANGLNEHVRKESKFFCTAPQEGLSSRFGGVAII